MEVIVNCFIDENNTCLINSLIIAGSGDKKSKLLENDSIQKYFKSKDKILDTINISSISSENINSALNQCIDIFNKNKFKKHYDTIDKVKELILVDDNRLVFGEKEILENIDSLKEIIISEEINFDPKGASSKCLINIVPSFILKEIGIKCVGIKWY